MVVREGRLHSFGLPVQEFEIVTAKSTYRNENMPSSGRTRENVKERMPSPVFPD
jgi:hypothetical protein